MSISPGVGITRAKRGRERRLRRRALAVVVGIAAVFALSVTFSAARADASERDGRTWASSEHGHKKHVRKHKKHRKEKADEHKRHEHKAKRHHKQKPCGPYVCRGKCEPCKNGKGTCKKRPPCRTCHKKHPKPPADKPKPPVDKPKPPKPPVIDDRPGFRDQPKPGKAKAKAPAVSKTAPKPTVKKAAPAQTANVLPFTGPEADAAQFHPNRAQHLLALVLAFVAVGSTLVAATRRPSRNRG